MKKLWVAVIPVIFGCSHVVPHGTIAMKVRDNVGVASVHNVSPGQKVSLLQNECTPPMGPTDGDYQCKRTEVSQGTVARVINEHYAEVHFPQGTQVNERQMIEVIR